MIDKKYICVQDTRNVNIDGYIGILCCGGNNLGTTRGGIRNSLLCCGMYGYGVWYVDGLIDLSRIDHLYFGFSHLDILGKLTSLAVMYLLLLIP